MMKFKGAADSFMESFNRKVAERKAEQERQRALMKTQQMVNALKEQYPGEMTPIMEAAAMGGNVTEIGNMAKTGYGAKAATQKAQQDVEQAEAQARAETDALDLPQAPQGFSVADIQQYNERGYTEQGKAADRTRDQQDAQSKLYSAYLYNQSIGEEFGLEIPDMAREDVQQEDVDYWAKKVSMAVDRAIAEETSTRGLERSKELSDYNRTQEASQKEAGKPPTADVESVKNIIVQNVNDIINQDANFTTKYNELKAMEKDARILSLWATLEGEDHVMFLELWKWYNSTVDNARRFAAQEPKK